MFTIKTLDFLFENRLQDSRDWFESHKPEYNEYVLAPLQDLVNELAPAMLQIDGDFVTDARVDKTISRIRRDTRFSRDKSLYRDSMWVIFKRGKMHGTELPGYYFEVTTTGFRYGCGFYDASTAYMETLRGLIVNGDKTFAPARRAFETQDVFQMEGDCYKRAHFPDQPEPLRLWLERRGICFTAESRELDLLFSEELSARLLEGFRQLAPVYRFLLRAALAVPRRG